jgi:hypothetical protein
VAVDIHAYVTFEQHAYSGDAQSGSLKVQPLTFQILSLLLLGVISAEHLCPKIRQFAREMRQILHPQHQNDLCSQTYPQKMGIDNSHAAVSDLRGVSDVFVESVVEVTAEENNEACQEKSGRRTHLPRVIGTVETSGGL